jgi:hypothetical protein
VKRIIIVLAFLSVLMLACNISVTNTPAGGGETPAVGTSSVAETESGAGTIAPAATATLETNVSCGNLSFYRDSSLASGFSCITVPEAANLDYPPFAVNPEYPEVTLTGYVLADRFMDPHIDVFPVLRFKELLPDLVNPRIAALQALIGGGTPIADEYLPVLPIWNAAELIRAQYAVVPFQNGSGIRYITQYAQNDWTVNNHDMFLSFQGLTSDGKYWISLVLPISHPSLPEIGDNQPGFDWPAYYVQIANQLNGQTPESFIPSILALDALINSITIAA